MVHQYYDEPLNIYIYIYIIYMKQQTLSFAKNCPVNVFLTSLDSLPAFALYYAWLTFDLYYATPPEHSPPPPYLSLGSAVHARLWEVPAEICWMATPSRPTTFLGLVMGPVELPWPHWPMELLPQAYTSLSARRWETQCEVRRAHRGKQWRTSHWTCTALRNLQLQRSIQTNRVHGPAATSRRLSQNFTLYRQIVVFLTPPWTHHVLEHSLKWSFKFSYFGIQSRPNKLLTLTRFCLKTSDVELLSIYNM